MDQATRDIGLLEAEHTALEQMILEEEQCFTPDALRLTAWKKRKLWIKDRLVALRAQVDAPPGDRH